MNSTLELVDVFLRFASIGQLVLVVVNLMRAWPPTMSGSLLLMLCPCVASYLLLTAPISQNLDEIRGLLLVLTHATPYLLWGLVLSLFGRLSFQRWPALTWPFIAAFFLWHAYFFGYLKGIGFFHDASHVLYVVLLSHVVYLSIRGMEDDLMASRRRVRMLVLAVVGVQLMLVTIVEIANVSVVAEDIQSLLNASMFFVVVSGATTHLLVSPRAEILEENSTASRSTGEDFRENRVVPAPDRKLYDQLMQYMAAGGYRRANLTIRRLAGELAVPEHHLRRLINQQLGHRNFSTFLNAYRIKEACERLIDPDQLRTPILTIALEVGYGSIGPFNRAFKAAVGQTPTEYRKEMQK